MSPSCLRCRDVALQPMSAHGTTALVCSRCSGLWLDHDAAVRVAHHAIQGATSAAHEGLACPVCAGALSSWNARGVVIDRCDAHGLWFDHAELERLIALSRGTTGSPEKRDDTAFETAADVLYAIFDVFT